MAVLVRRHLGQAENSEAALEAVVVRLLVGVRARIDATVLRRREFLEPGGEDRVGLLVLATVGHHLVRVRANKVAFEAMKMRGFVLYCAYRCQHHSAGKNEGNLNKKKQVKLIVNGIFEKLKINIQIKYINKYDLNT